MVGFSFITFKRNGYLIFIFCHSSGSRNPRGVAGNRNISWITAFAGMTASLFMLFNAARNHIANTQPNTHAQSSK
jgi:hypothetical protein